VSLRVHILYFLGLFKNNSSIHYYSPVRRRRRRWPVRSGAVGPGRASGSGGGH